MDIVQKSNSNCNHLFLFREIIAACLDNHTEYTDTLREQTMEFLAAKAGNT
jgi:hypothetical protein